MSRTCTCRCSPATTACCARWDATTPRPSTSSTSTRVRDAVPARQHHDRRDRRLPDRGPSARSSARWRRSTTPESHACTRSRTHRGPARSPPRSATGSRRRRRSAARRSCVARSEVRSRHHRSAKLGRVETGAGRQGRRHAVLGVHGRLHALLSAGRRGRAGRVGATSRCVELQADGHQVRDCGSAGAILRSVTVAEQVRADMTSAMKAGEKDRVGALRLVLSELQKAAKDGDDDELAVLRRERKRRLEAATQFRDGGRPELADSEESEAQLIEGYLPAELDDAELRRDRRRRDRRDRRVGPADMGQVMKAVMAKSGGRADGKRASARSYERRCDRLGMRKAARARQRGRRRAGGQRGRRPAHAREPSRLRRLPARQRADARRRGAARSRPRAPSSASCRS